MGGRGWLGLNHNTGNAYFGMDREGNSGPIRVLEWVMMAERVCRIHHVHTYVFNGRR